MTDLFAITSASIRIDVKNETDAGYGTSSASGNVTVNFNKSFATVTAITVTPNPASSGRYYAGTIFDETQGNPTSFDVFILDANGANVAVEFSWIVRGVRGA